MSNLDYISDTLPNGLRLVHLPVDSPVAYCGLAVNAGTRDERPDEMGLAHFVEHMLFKGTDKRRSWHILNRRRRPSSTRSSWRSISGGRSS